MAEFLTRKGIVHHLGRIIREAEKELVLISPYINANDETKKLIADTTRAITIHVIYGKKEELTQNERGFFDERSVKLSYRKNLHAKCYLSEKEAILTSMNLLESSMQNNDEMGILVSGKDDQELYEAIYKQAMEWKEATSVLQALEKGFCIRCKADLPADPALPYCRRCYASWVRHQNKGFKEKHCHTCGNEHTTTFLEPLCPDCNGKYKDAFEFAVS